ncbi:MAG: response regulator [Treponema sp.]|jgi:signal transduction histidine kinase/CheY-like chemotaxis protein/HPt (histidine-containing phosphotransfer) domain-containing protein|nr:response regulator [Treponema sp.]
MEESGKNSADTSFTTEPRLAKQRPARRQSTYYYFFRDSSSAMAITDKWGTLVEGNDRFHDLIESLSGAVVDIKSNTASLGSSLDFLPIHDAVRFSNFLSKLANDAADKMDFKTPYRDRNEGIHWLGIHAWKMNIDPRVDLSGRGPFIGFIINDETVEIEAEEKLQEDMKIAEKAMEAKSLFLATMSHEIRTPIQTIIGMAELLDETILDKSQDEYVQQIKFSADILLSLINNILDYSKIEAGKMYLERIPFSPAENIEQAVKMFSIEIEKKGLELVLEMKPGVRQQITGDPGKFRQVLINIIKNAVKFTSMGKITISAELALGDEKIRTITISVADTGIGVPDEARERLFTTFMQADSSHTRRFGGTGLGLAISRTMVELMGGTIEMIPNKGGGSIFRFTIPAEEAEPETLNDLVIPLEVVKSMSVTEVSFSGKVLIVEDYSINRNLFVMIMEKMGIQTIQAEDGIKALEKVSSDIDMVFMDIQMPQMNGYETAAEMRRQGFKMPIIAVTAGVLGEEQKQCREAGFNDILFKPFKKPVIEAMFHKWAAKTKQNDHVDDPFNETPAEPAENQKNFQIFNRDFLMDTFMNDGESAKALLVRFLDRITGQLGILPALMEKKDWAEAYRIAHTIKGTAMTFSGMELGNAAARLERAYKLVDLKEMESALPHLMETYKNFKNAADEFLQS